LIYFAGDRNPRLDQINTNQIPPGTGGTNQFIYDSGGSADGAVELDKSTSAGHDRIRLVSATLL
jgi:hypothetical protein